MQDKQPIEGCLIEERLALTMVERRKKNTLHHQRVHAGLERAITHASQVVRYEKVVLIATDGSATSTHEHAGWGGLCGRWCTGMEFV